MVVLLILLSLFTVQSQSQSTVDTTHLNQTSDDIVLDEMRITWNPTDWPVFSSDTENITENTTDEFTYPCSWAGVVCNEFGRVTRLTLNSRNVSGTIPSSLGKLSFLEHLYLFNNSLVGTIPEQIGNLKMLTHLSLGRNLLVGTLPATLDGLESLRYLYLFGNQLEGDIPGSLGNLRNLRHVGMWSNKLSGTLPREIGNLKNLEYLGLNGNSISGTLPPSLFDEMTQVKQIYLSGNAGLQGTLPSIRALDSLEGLYISKTNISGTLSCEMVHLPKLRIVEASDTQIESCTSLECLRALPECNRLDELNLQEHGIEL